ncbi:hypothetical protein AC578_1114 [Pseudocercospora eumusae]|uniref:Uncharacterized protein n=1 Tax=Pseudocercospora eumusae TaxID=321146 RepID=A0A139HTR5_9PEZI|nr:hypothetical protein AC578_1114 [Pseudocercospora eumusae]
MAEKFLKKGISFVVVGRRQENLEAFAKKHSQNSHIDTAAFDITDLKGIPKFAQDITAKHPDLDCVFLNAGVQRHVNWKEPENTLTYWRRSSRPTSYLSYMHLTKAFLPFLQKQAPKETSIVYVTSGLALVPNFYCPNYVYR